MKKVSKLHWNAHLIWDRLQWWDQRPGTTERVHSSNSVVPIFLAQWALSFSCLHFNYPARQATLLFGSVFLLGVALPLQLTLFPATYRSHRIPFELLIIRFDTVKFVARRRMSFLLAWILIGLLNASLASSNAVPFLTQVSLFLSAVCNIKIIISLSVVILFRLDSRRPSSSDPGHRFLAFVWS